MRPECSASECLPRKTEKSKGGFYRRPACNTSRSDVGRQHFGGSSVNLSSVEEESEVDEEQEQLQREIEERLTELL